MILLVWAYFRPDLWCCRINLDLISWLMFCYAVIWDACYLLPSLSVHYCYWILMIDLVQNLLIWPFYLVQNLWCWFGHFIVQNLLIPHPNRMSCRCYWWPVLFGDCWFWLFCCLIQVSSSTVEYSTVLNRRLDSLSVKIFHDYQSRFLCWQNLSGLFAGEIAEFFMVD